MENKGFNWLKIAIEVLVIFIFVLILVWIFPMPGKNTNSNYDENFETFRNTAKNYFTVDRLPKNVGDTVRMSLDEMIQKNIIRELKDEKGNSCDVSKSYVLVSKISDTNYQLRVELSCGNETDYVLDTIGCYDTCNYVTDNNNNTNNGNGNNGYKTTTNTTTSGTIVQYRYKTQRVVKHVSYKCDEGYALNGTKCVKLKGTSIAATAQYSEEKDVYMDPVIAAGPMKTIYADPIIKDGGETASCPEKEGYFYNNSRDLCVKPGSSYNATKHTKTVDDSYSYDATGTTKYTSWEYKYTQKYESKKYDSDTTKYEKTGEGYELRCPDGTTNCECPKNVYVYTYRVYTRSKYTEYSCPNGGSLSGSKCYVSASHNEDYYTCDNGGKLDGTKCYIDEKTKKPTKDREKIYTCPEGYESSGSDINLTCYKQVPTDGKAYCSDSSYTYNEKTNKCVKHINKEFIGYKCPTGYQLDGDKCYKSGETVDARKWTKCIVITTYTWNSNANLAGWTKTGETRTINK